MQTTEPGPETQWSDWGPPVRVRIDAAPVMILARTLDDTNPVYASERAAAASGFASVPTPPTFTFVMAHSGAFPDLQPPGSTGSLFSRAAATDDSSAAHGGEAHADATTSTRAAATDDSGAAHDGEAHADAATGLYLHGEQYFTYHRQPVVGDVLEGRMRVSVPVARVARRGPMEVTFFQTEWRDLDGAPVVSEQIVSLFFPEP
ncbi:MAG TPA: MaoC family dehydratase N-terminal domain-containing protein [Acidimicrobiia bacterium]